MHMHMKPCIWTCKIGVYISISTSISHRGAICGHVDIDVYISVSVSISASMSHRGAIVRVLHTDPQTHQDLQSTPRAVARYVSYSREGGREEGGKGGGEGGREGGRGEGGDTHIRRMRVCT